MPRVTRRAFLRAAALAGGGALLPRCRSALPRDARDVVVLGAGMAGLAASRELLRAGVDVIVLEARGRVGGRMQTLAEPAPHGVEIGAQMIHGSRAPVLWDLVHALEVETRPMRGWGERWLQRPDGSFAARDAALERRVRERLQEAYREHSGADVSLQAFLDPLELSGLEREIAWENALSWSAEPDEISLAAALRDSAAWDDYWDQNYQVVGGYGRFAARLAQALGERIRLSCRVQGIEWGDAGVRVTYQREGHRETLAARRALVTLPIGILQAGSPAFQPALPVWKRRCIEALAMGRVVVVPMLFRDAFWRERGPDWHSWSSQAGRVSFWDPHGPGLGAPSLQAWITGRAAQEVSDLGREAGLARVLAWLEQALPGSRPRARLEWWELGDWVRDPFARGSYSYTRPGGYGQRAVLAKPLEGRLFFAGEATLAGPHYQTVHGAAMSAQRAVREILASLGFETAPLAFAAPQAAPALRA